MGAGMRVSVYSRVEIGIVGDLVVSRVAATMALPKGLP